MISLPCAWVLKASIENPHTRHNKYSHALKTHAKSKHNQPKGINVLKPMQGGTSDSQNNHANRLKPMHRLAKSKKTAYAQNAERRRTTSHPQPQRQGGTHTHALAQLRLARSHATHDERNDFPVRGFSSSHST